MKRSAFLQSGLFGLPAFLVAPNFSRFQDKIPLDDQLVNEFVRAGHNDLAAVKQMLDEEPALLNASWDWGNGDFETALGGASHMGNREIATFLINSGARTDIFTYAMLGDLEVIRKMTEKYSSLLTSEGPHGISLYTHAVKGGDAARDVIRFLENQGITE